MAAARAASRWSGLPIACRPPLPHDLVRCLRAAVVERGEVTLPRARLLQHLFRHTLQIAVGHERAAQFGPEAVERCGAGIEYETVAIEQGRIRRERRCERMARGAQLVLAGVDPFGEELRLDAPGVEEIAVAFGDQRPLRDARAERDIVVLERLDQDAPAVIRALEVSDDL